MTTTIRIDPRFCGPPGTGNGGYVAGRLASALVPGVGEGVEVTLRAPAPLDTPLVVTIDGEGARLLADANAVASARIVPFAPPVAWAPVGVDVARRLGETSTLLRGAGEHPFPRCFVCGPDRDAGDGLRLFPNRVPGTGDFAVEWTVTEPGDEMIWAALDCPSSFPMYLDEDPFAGPCVLGRITAAIESRPAVGDACVVVSRRVGVDGRKLHTASVLLDAGGARLAAAAATWIRVAPTS